MATFRFEGVRVLLAEADPQMRGQCLDVLFRAGFKTVVDVLDLKDAADFVRAGRVDLLILDADLPGGDTAELIRDIRHSQVGNNPFLVIIALLAVPDAATVRRVVNAGADDVVVKPALPEVLLDRIQGLARVRKPFVVTRDYIGPDRRRGARPEPQRVPLIEVPNILNSKALGATDSVTLKRMVESVTARINAEKADRYVSILEETVPRLKEQHERTGSLAEAVEELKRLETLAEDLARRLRGSQYAHVAEVALSLGGICARLAA